DLRDVLLAVAPGAAEPDMRDQTLLRGFGDPPLSHPEPGGDIDVGHQIHWASLLMPENRRVPSPRARGALGAAHRGSAQGGTIPACAGSTRHGDSCFRVNGDHPRVRGEHCTGEVDEVDLQGPSPRARGALVVSAGRPRGAGTIPACAGSTLVDLGFFSG